MFIDKYPFIMRKITKPINENNENNENNNELSISNLETSFQFEASNNTELYNNMDYLFHLNKIQMITRKKILLLCFRYF